MTTDDVDYLNLARNQLDRLDTGHRIPYAEIESLSQAATAAALIDLAASAREISKSLRTLNVLLSPPNSVKARTGDEPGQGAES